MKAFKTLGTLSVLLCAIWSCQKDNEDPEQRDLSIAATIELATSVDEAEALLDENILYAITSLDLGPGTGKGLGDRSHFFPECMMIAIAMTETTGEITIGFGEGCTDSYGNSWAGSLKLSTNVLEGAGDLYIVFSDLTINDYVVNGTKSLAYTPANTQGNPELSGTVDIQVDTEWGTLTKTGNRKFEMTAGGDTGTFSDDEITISGSSVFTTADGSVFSVEITSPLIRPSDCKYITRGTMRFSRAGSISLLDYGDGTCDKVALLTEADGTVTEVSLGKVKKG